MDQGQVGEEAPASGSVRRALTTEVEGADSGEVSPVDEASLLKNQISAMENALAEARKYLSEIEAEKK